MTDAKFYELVLRVSLSENATKNEKLLLLEEVLKSETRLNEYLQARHKLIGLAKPDASCN